MRWILPTLLSCLVASTAFGAAKPRAGKLRPRHARLTIRAFGDSAYIGANGAFGDAPPDWVRAHLSQAEILRSPDVNFMNLEGSLTRSCRRFEAKTFEFAVSPATLIQYARWGFNLIGLANNHSLDCLQPSPGPESARSLSLAQAAVPGMAAHGVAASAADLAARVAKLTVRGVTLGMVAMKAWDGGAGAPVGNIDNRIGLFNALAHAPVDVRVLSLHGGVEGTRAPTADLIKIAHEFLASYGGDIVFAHHPHKSQGFELVAKADGRYGVIFYSLGNSLHNGLSAAGDGLVGSVDAGKDGIDPDSLMAFPLANSAIGPRPVTDVGLTAISKILKASDYAISRYALPYGLTRVPITFRTVASPAPGVQLIGKKPNKTVRLKPRTGA